MWETGDGVKKAGRNGVGDQTTRIPKKERYAMNENSVALRANDDETNTCQEFTLGGIGQHPVVMPKSKTAGLLQQPALIRRTAGGRRSFQRRLLRRLNFWTVPVAAHSRRKTSCASLRRSTARRGSPERSARSWPRGALLVSAVGLAASARRGRLRRAKPRQARSQNRRTKPAGGGTLRFRGGRTPAEAAVGARRNDHRTPKKPSRTRPPVGIETVVLYPGCGRERPSTFGGE